MWPRMSSEWRGAGVCGLEGGREEAAFQSLHNLASSRTCRRPAPRLAYSPAAARQPVNAVCAKKKMCVTVVTIVF